MRLRDFMSRAVETVSPEDSIESAFQKMQGNNIRHLVVLSGHMVAGVLSERDVNGLTSREREGRRVQDIMETHVVMAGPDTTIREAANLMRGHTIGCLPILENHRLIGIITTTDLLDLLGQGIERIVADTEKRSVSRENPGRKQASFNPGLRQ
jgi:acetoin utilization protein AcuB